MDFYVAAFLVYDGQTEEKWEFETLEEAQEHALECVDDRDNPIGVYQLVCKAVLGEAPKSIEQA